MKFSKVVLSVVAVVAIASVGGSWYTGKEVENRYQQLINRSNKQLKELEGQGIFAQITDVKFERHFFSSDVAYRFVAELDGEQFVLNGEDKLYHGPLPLNRLAQFKLVPVLASWQSKLGLPEQLQKKLQRSLLGEGVADITYSGVIEGNFDIPGFSYQGENGEKLDLSTVKTNYRYEQNSNDIQGETFAEQLQLSSHYGEKTELLGLNYRFTHTLNKDYPKLPIGRNQLAIKQVKGSREHSVELKDLNVLFNGKVEGERALTDGVLSWKSLSIDGAELGSMNLLTDWNADAALYQQFLDLSASGEVETEIAENVMLKLLSKKPAFNIKELKLDNAGGKADLSLALNFNTFSPENVADLSDVLKALSQSSLDIVLDKEYVTQFMQASGQHSPEEAKNVTEQFFGMLQMAEIGKVDEKQAKLALSINDGKVSLNGKELSEEELQGWLLMLAMLGLF